MSFTFGSEADKYAVSRLRYRLYRQLIDGCSSPHQLSSFHNQSYDHIRIIKRQLHILYGFLQFQYIFYIISTLLVKTTHHSFYSAKRNPIIQKVGSIIHYNYFYGRQSELFQFYKIPRQLILGMEFHILSTDSKLLYGLMLDRMGLSAKNGWYDDLGRVYIYYTLDEI